MARKRNKDFDQEIFAGLRAGKSPGEIHARLNGAVSRETIARRRRELHGATRLRTPTRAPARAEAPPARDVARPTFGTFTQNEGWRPLDGVSARIFGRLIMWAEAQRDPRAELEHLRVDLAEIGWIERPS